MNCKWNDTWVKDGQCSKECGGGVQKFTKSKNVAEANGGTCKGHDGVDRKGKGVKDVKKEVCNPQACLGKFRYIIYIMNVMRKIINITNVIMILMLLSLMPLYRFVQM